MEPSAPATISSTVPAPAQSSESINPMSPTTSTPDTSGPASRLATGEIIDHAPNVDTLRGSVAACAVRVSARGGANSPHHRGNAAPTHTAANLANTTSPTTDATESWKPRSKATGGDAANETSAATQTAARLSARRPESTAPEPATAIAHARTAEGWTPVATTYRPTTATTASRAGTRGTLHVENNQVSSAATTTR